MEFKFLEIRDAATFIPALAVTISGNDGYLARRAGFGRRLVILIHLQTMRSTYDSYDWDNRTMSEAHHYIASQWASLKDGAVIDVEFILGESTSPKVSEADSSRLERTTIA